MGRIEDLRIRYDRVRRQVEDVVSEVAAEELAAWGGGDLAQEMFGPGANSLDALCLMAVFEKTVPGAMAHQIQGALSEGHSWEEIAAALGVSRQAAVKRFR